MIEKARRSGAYLPYNATTAYRNTIPKALEERSPGDAEAATPPQPATYGPCPDIEIEGETYPLGDNCQFVDGELVAVHIGSGWVTSE